VSCIVFAVRISFVTAGCMLRSECSLKTPGLQRYWATLLTVLTNMFHFSAHCSPSLCLPCCTTFLLPTRLRLFCLL